MSGTIRFVGVLVEHTGSGFEQTYDMVINLCNRFARLVAVKGLRLGLDRHFPVGAHKEEISEGFLETQFTQGVVLISR